MADFSEANGNFSHAISLIRRVGIYDPSRPGPVRWMEGMCRRNEIQLQHLPLGHQANDDETTKASIDYEPHTIQELSLKANPWHPQDLVEWRYRDSAWFSFWSGKQSASGQEASRMFLLSLVAACYREITAALANAESRNRIGTSAPHYLEDGLDACCAILRYNEFNGNAMVGLRIQDVEAFFSYFRDAFNLISLRGLSLNAKDDRNYIAILIGAMYRNSVSIQKLSDEQEGRLCAFAGGPATALRNTGIQWVQSRGLWSSALNQFEAADAFIRLVCGRT